MTSKFMNNELNWIRKILITSEKDLQSAHDGGAL